MGDGGQLDLFQVTAIDPPWRDNKDAMGYPFVALQKRRTTAIRYSDADVWLMVSAAPEFGIATIWDWDVMIFAASHINEAIESRRQISPRITFVPHDCLKQIGRPIGGRSYQLLADAIRRLHATSVITDIREADQSETGEEQGFHWLTGYRLPKKYCRHYTTPDNITHITPRDSTGEADPTRPWVIELPPWIYNAIVRRGDILAVHPDYFQLTGGLERWLYRLARKAVPDKAEPPAIRFKMETLHARAGVTNDLRHFACDIREIAKTQPLPEYGVQVEHRKGRRELVTLYRDKAKPCRPPRGRRLKTIEGEPIKPAVTTDTYLNEEPPLVIVPEVIAEPILEDIAEQVYPAPAAIEPTPEPVSTPSTADEASEEDGVSEQWVSAVVTTNLRYLAEAADAPELLRRMTELMAGMPPPASYTFVKDGTTIPTNPPPDLSPDLEAKLRLAHDHLRRIAERLMDVSLAADDKD